MINIKCTNTSVEDDFIKLTSTKQFTQRRLAKTLDLHYKHYTNRSRDSVNIFLSDYIIVIIKRHND